MAILNLDWCSYEAAKYAVEHWHYSRRMPAGKTVKVGVWENNKFIGCVIFGRGSTPRIGYPYGLEQTEICELVRVALTGHVSPVSKITAIALKMLKKVSPGTRLVVSYADPSEGHHGGIYQAGNWIYVGDTELEREVIINGKAYHRRSAGSRFGSYALDYLHKHVDPHAQYAHGVIKHKYLYPLDDAMRKQIEPLRKPYPKRANEATQDAAGDQPEEGGADPTRSLI